MKKLLLHLVAPVFASAFLFSAALASECPGPWSILPNFPRGEGGACRAIGLSSHRPVCQEGQQYATLCENAPGGLYKLCLSDVPCYPTYRQHEWHERHSDDRDWHRDRDRDRDRDRRDYNRRDDNRDCTHWDYSANRPCPPGTLNMDCRNDCQSY